jgi:hypothetical protein
LRQIISVKRPCPWTTTSITKPGFDGDTHAWSLRSIYGPINDACRRVKRCESTDFVTGEACSSVGCHPAVLATSSLCAVLASGFWSSLALQLSSSTFLITDCRSPMRGTEHCSVSFLVNNPHFRSLSYSHAKPTLDTSGTKNRTHSRIVLGVRESSMSNACSPTELVMALRDAIVGQ